MAKITYEVKVSYHYFRFEDQNDALSFARMAKTHYLKDDKKDKLDVTVSLIEIAEETEEAGDEE